MQAHKQAKIKQQVADFNRDPATCRVDELEPPVEVAYLRGSNTPEFVSTVPRPFNPGAIGLVEGRPVIRLAERLRPHHAITELGWAGLIGELDDARLKNQSGPEPILVTTNGTILVGLGRWKLALLAGEKEIPCIEYALSEDEALQFILEHHQPSRGWNPFVRIRLALTLEPYLQQKALDNMRAGGKYKGSAALPNLKQIDVRQEIANAASVGARNVSNVKVILRRAHPRIIQALTEDSLTINRAVRFCKLPRAEQLEQFIHYTEDRAVDGVIRQAIPRPGSAQTSPEVDTVLRTLQEKEARQPGSIGVRVSRLQQTVVLVGRDLLPELPRWELKST